jgi:hypothetical protein
MIIYIFPNAAGIIIPPDPITQAVVSLEMAVIYGLLLFIVYRFESFKQTLENIKKLIVVLVCLLSITITSSLTLFRHVHWYQSRIEQSKLADSAR